MASQGGYSNMFASLQVPDDEAQVEEGLKRPGEDEVRGGLG